MPPPVVYMIFSAAILAAGVLLGASITYAATHNRKPIQFTNVAEATKKVLGALAYPLKAKEVDEVGEARDPKTRRTS